MERNFCGIQYTACPDTGILETLENKAFKKIAYFISLANTYDKKILIMFLKKIGNKHGENQHLS